MCKPYETFDEVLDALADAEQNFSAEQKKVDCLMKFIQEKDLFEELLEFMNRENKNA